MIEDALDHLNYIEEYLVTDSDRESYRAWLRQYLSPIMKDVGWESKPGESDEQKALRARVFYALGYDARDPDALAEASKLAEKALDNPASVSHEMAANAFRLAALNGDQTLYDKLLALLKNAKSPEEYYMALFALPHFDNPKLLERTLDFAISPDVRSQDALRLIGNVMQNPAGEKLAWEFILNHWNSVQKAGGPFASAEIVAATSSFCDAHMRDQVADFFAAHKIESAERTYRQSIERINDCIELKSQQEPKLASWLGEHGSAAGGQ